jgi:RHS repeat-associated protein
VSNPIRLQGQYEDGETGLYYNRHRYYDPFNGEFVSQDPLGIDPGENNHEFGPNTTGWTDPLGLTCHGNSKLSPIPNHIHEIKNKKTGEIYKYGISGGKIRVDGKSSRAELQVRKLNSKAGADIFESRIIKKDVSRNKALKIEQGRVNSYSIARQRGGTAVSPTAPLGNIRPSAKM